MSYLVFFFIAVLAVLLFFHIISIVMDYLSPDISVIKKQAPECANKKCAFYHVTANPNTVQEDATCYRGVNGFESMYRGSKSCAKSVAFFGKSPKDTYSLLEKRKKDLLSSFGSLSGYIALILSLVKTFPNGS